MTRLALHDRPFPARAALQAPWTKAINALVMSLAAVPAYFLARRVLSPPLPGEGRRLVGAQYTVFAWR